MSTRMITEQLAQASLPNATSLRPKPNTKLTLATAVRTALFPAGILGVIALSWTPAINAAQLTVTNLNNTGAGSLRNAISSAVSGDEIIFSSNLNCSASVPCHITLSSGVIAVTNKTLTITGPGADSLTIHANNARIFNITNNGTIPPTVTVSGVTLTAGNAGSNSPGGAINCTNASLILNSSILTGNTAGTYGGAVYATATNSALSPAPHIEISNSTISNNTATAGGGGIGVFVLTAVFGNIDHLTLTNSTVSGNISNGAGSFAGGGGIYTYGVNNVSALANSAITDNDAAAAGGGLKILQANNITLTNATITGNTASDNGGGAYLYATTTTISQSTITGNNAQSGGGLAFQGGTNSIDTSSVATNTASDGGGGIAATSGNLTVTSSTISNNIASGSGSNGGGGILTTFGLLSLSDSTVSTNSAVAGTGGGISVGFNSRAAITASTIDHNSAACSGACSGTIGEGGGLMFAGSGTSTVINSTISDNTSAGRGGGIGTASGTVTLANSTVASNIASNSDPHDGQGGGITTNGGGSVTVRNSIVALNTVPNNGNAHPDLDGSFTVNYSLIGSDDGATFLTGSGNNNVGTNAQLANPLIGVLADNGGSTQTRLPQSNSPAIDTGDPALLQANCDNVTLPCADQRGAVRIQNGKNAVRIDMGAVEISDIIFQDGFDP